MQIQAYENKRKENMSNLQSSQGKSESSKSREAFMHKRLHTFFTFFYLENEEYSYARVIASFLHKIRLVLEEAVKS